MEKVIFSGFGCQLYRRKKRYYVRYDSGGSSSQMLEKEITRKESKQFQKSEDDAYQILLKIQQRDGIPSRGIWSWIWW